MEQLMNESKLQILTERAWDLHSKINDRIHQNGYSFCSHCSNHGRHCVVAENTVEERETMIGIKNSLKDVHSNILVLLQGVKSSQTKQRHEALSHLDESRRLLVERMDQCSEKVRKLDVIKELIAFLGDGKTGFVMNSKVKEKRLNGICSFFVSTTRFALEYAVMFVSIYSAVTLYNHRQKNERLKGEIAAAVDTTVRRKMVTDSNINLDVLCGRG